MRLTVLGVGQRAQTFVILSAIVYDYCLPAIYPPDMACDGDTIPAFPVGLTDV